MCDSACLISLDLTEITEDATIHSCGPQGVLVTVIVEKMDKEMVSYPSSSLSNKGNYKIKS